MQQNADAHQSRSSIAKRRAGKRAKVAASRKANDRPKKPFRFLDLPAELRDQIYELALTDDALALVSRTKGYRRTVARGLISEELPGAYYKRRIRRRDDAFHAQQSQSQGNEGPHPPRALIPALLAVNQQIHSEAVGFLYQQPITLEDTYALHSFLATIGSNRPRLTDITVRGWGNGRGTHKAMNFTAFTLLADCINLKILSLDCQIGWLRKPKNLARQVYRDTHFFLEGYGAAHGRRDAAVDLLELNDWNYDKANGHWYARLEDLPDVAGFKGAFHEELRSLLESRK